MAAMMVGYEGWQSARTVYMTKKSIFLFFLNNPHNIGSQNQLLGPDYMELIRPGSYI